MSAAAGPLRIATVVLLCLATFFLWRISQRVEDRPAASTAPTASTTQSGAVPQLPPPSSGAASGKGLLREFDRTSTALGRPLGDLLQEFRSANLGSLNPSLRELLGNTNTLPATSQALQQMVGQLHRLEALGSALTALRVQLAAMARGLAPLGQGLRATSGGLGGVNRNLAALRRAIEQTNAALGGTNSQLAQTNQQLKATQQALEHTNACLERPVVCQVK
jgi:ABC-type transporter Mla subunit MlaD